MKKLSIIIMTVVLSAPIMGMAADKDTVDDQALVAASYQQGEDASDPAAPITKPVSAPALNEQSAATAATADASPAQAAPAVNSVSKIVDSLSQQATTLRNDVEQLQQQNTLFGQQLTEIEYAVYGLAGLVVLLILLSLIRRSKKSHQAKRMELAAATPNDAQAEYDFMGSSEGIPAKLDLARAYIAMEDFTAARETLNEILQEGNEQNQREARELLNKINK